MNQSTARRGLSTGIRIHDLLLSRYMANDEVDKNPFGENLLDKANRDKLPPLYSNEQLGLMAIALVKFFTPDSNWTWYASEFDGDDTFFGLVAGFDVELGYFLLSELQSVRGPLGLQVERDLHYEPKTLAELFAKLGNLK